MNSLDLNSYGLEEMNEVEMVKTGGGQEFKYFEYVWYDGSNPIVYAAYAGFNCGTALTNGGIWIWNQFQ